MKKFTRILSVLLALVMMLSLAACSPKTPETPDESKPAVTDPVETEPATDPVETQPDATVDATESTETAIVFFSMSFGTDYENVHSLTAFPNEDGTIRVEYVGNEKKIGNLDADIMNSIADEFAKTELATLNGEEAYEEGDASASMYVEFSDGSTLIANYTGTIHENFISGYNAMDAHFQTLTADMPVYVPQPMVMGEVNEAILNEIMTILNGSGIPNLDAIGIGAINTTDEFFAGSAGLTSADGIANAGNAAPMMLAQAYSLVIVELAEGADAEAIGADFEQNIDWRKWVCVAPSNALIAVKDNMVLCLQAADDMYTMTIAGIDAAGWTHVTELTNPDLG